MLINTPKGNECQGIYLTGIMSLWINYGMAERQGEGKKRRRFILPMRFYKAGLSYIGQIEGPSESTLKMIRKEFIGGNGYVRGRVVADFTKEVKKNEGESSKLFKDCTRVIEQLGEELTPPSIDSGNGYAKRIADLRFEPWEVFLAKYGRLFDKGKGGMGK